MRLHRARTRAAEGRTIIEGPTLLAEAVAGGAVIETVFHTGDDEHSRALAVRAGAEAVPVTREVLERMATTDTPQSPVAVVQILPGDPTPGGDVLVAWGVGDPGNVGTLLRTAVALGMGFATGPGTADPWSPKVVRAGAGAHFRRPPQRIADPSELGRVVVAAVPAGGVDPGLLPAGDLAILIGDEAAGLPDRVVEAADVVVTIPMPGGTESLNAAVAGAIIAYESSRRRAGGGAAKG